MTKLTLQQTLKLFLVSIVLIGITCLYIVNSTLHKAQENEEWVTHTYQVIIVLESVRNHIQIAESNQRGFLLTLNEAYLDSFTESIDLAFDELVKLKQLTTDSLEQQQKLKSLTKLTQAKFSELKKTVQLAKSNQLSESLNILKNNSGKKLMDQINTIITQLNDHEKYLLKIRENAFNDAKNMSKFLFIGCIILILFLVFSATIYIKRSAIDPLAKLTQQLTNTTDDNMPSISSKHASVEVKLLSNTLKRLMQDVNYNMNALKLAQRTAEESSQIKAQFLSNMSHEIRTPLNGIIGTLQILAQSKNEIKIQNLIDKSLLSSKSLLTIINDILDFSKMDAGMLNLEKTVFAFKEIAELVISDLTAIAREKGIALELHYDKNFVDGWMGDPVRVHQILLNLTSNAVKFTESGYVKIYISSSGLDAKSKLMITIEDTGSGMSPQTVSQLFTRFKQADSSTTRKFGGTGLGLAITHSLVTQMEGDINVSSELGEGSLFKVALPLAQAELTGAKVDQIATEMPNLSAKTILVAEDNEINQTIIEAMLSASQAKIIIVNNGKEAVEIAEAQQPDLIFLDIQMPVMDGIEACKIIRAMYPSLPILALTANVMADDVKFYYSIGFTDHLGKPIIIDLLHQKLNTYLAQSVVNH